MLTSECSFKFTMYKRPPLFDFAKRISIGSVGATPSFDLFPFKAKHSTGFDMSWGRHIGFDFDSFKAEHGWGELFSRRLFHRIDSGD